MIFRDYLLRQKATLDSKIKGFNIRLNSPIFKDLMNAVIIENKLKNVGRNSERDIGRSSSSSMSMSAAQAMGKGQGQREGEGEGGYLNFLLELTGISSVGDQTGLNNKYKNNNRNRNINNNNNNISDNSDDSKVQILDKMSNINANTNDSNNKNYNKNYSKDDTDTKNKIIINNENENKNNDNNKFGNTHSGKTKNNNHTSDPVSALEILCSQTKLAKLLVKQIDNQLKY